MGMVAVGVAVRLGTLLVQGVAGILCVEAIGRLLARRTVGAHIWSNALATLLILVVLLVGHLAQIAVWAAVLVVAGEFGVFTAAFHHSAVNYTTLGYGDIVMSPRVRLLGPLEAVSGTLAFGWSTAIIVMVVTRLARLRHQTTFRMRR
jgi:hypothetical protein